MIISGIQTGNTRWLARHLQNTVDNETIELAEVSGTVATDIDGALAEMDALCAGTCAKEGVYAAFINPPQPLTREQFMRAIALIEERLGLAGQSRIVLFHIKNGRHHCHVVWSRIDIEHMKAIHLSHDRQKLRKCAQMLAAEFGLTLPDGLKNDRGAERFTDPERAKRPTRAEKAQAKHSGIGPEERRAAITEAWRSSDSAESFRNSLEELGYLLAKGDSRAFVVVDLAGDVHSLARQIDGAKTKDVVRKLEGINLALLPSVEKGKILMLQRAAAMQDTARERLKKDTAAEAIRNSLLAAQRARKLQLDLNWQVMKVRHMHERKVLLAHFMAVRERHLARRKWQAVGLALYLKKIVFLRALVRHHEARQTKHKRSIEEFHRQLEDSMRRRHGNEAAELQRRYDALRRLDRLELRSLLQIQIQPYMRATWLGHDVGDYDGKIAFGVKLGHNRRQLDKDFDQHVELNRRKKLNNHSERVAKYQKTLAYMRESGIEITDDPASKWLPLQRKQAEVIQQTGRWEEFHANTAEVTRHGRNVFRGPPGPEITAPKS
ncbi:relaxase/mobilization nuclease domain-containing protein [Nitrobacter vulgaris]|uniref:MobA/VirD2-like nuclease domain-containing protein n=1 Tax=Nitrobacter vulgaris TaxID=29421 RepID=A0A1V4HX78_NITVU|nr:relaxase/mobilization nuclease domain-containing protein [Nitrobacter vulgaris]OPH82445.1 hypothetical protein B2M20_11645 [Nitrobacter vulgaris]